MPSTKECREMLLKSMTQSKDVTFKLMPCRFNPITHKSVQNSLINIPTSPNGFHFNFFFLFHSPLFVLIKCIRFDDRRSHVLYKCYKCALETDFSDNENLNDFFFICLFVRSMSIMRAIQ